MRKLLQKSIFNLLKNSTCVMNHFKIFQKIALLALILVGVSVSKAQAQGCPSDNTVTITVLADPTFALTPPSETTICSGGGGTITAAIPSGYGAVCTNFTWEQNTGSGWTTISGETAVTLTVTGLTATTQYRATWNCALSCGSPVSTNTVTMTVNPDITQVGTIASITQCEDGTAGTLTVTVTGGAGNYIYNWYETIDGTTPTGSALRTQTTASTSDTYTPDNTTVGTRQYLVVVTSSLSGGAGCGALTTTSATVQNVAPLTAGSVTSTLDECIGGTATISAPTISGGTGSFTYAWEVNTGSGFAAMTGTDGTAVTTSTSSVVTPTSTAASSRTYRVTITDATGTACNTITQTYTVTVSAAPALTVNTPPQTICVGGTVTLQATRTGGTGTCSISWEENTGSGWGAASGTVTAPTGTTSQIVTPPLTTAGAPQYRARVVCTGSGCCN
jgi:large repetitive protein